MTGQTCPLCAYEVKLPFTTIGDDLFQVECQRCGTFEITLEAETNVRGLSSRDHRNISGYARQADLEYGAGVRSTRLRIVRENVETLPGLAPIDVLERLDRFVLNFARMSRYAGQKINVDPNLDVTIGYCSSPEEFLFFVSQLQTQGLLERTPEGYLSLAALD